MKKFESLEQQESKLRKNEASKSPTITSSSIFKPLIVIIIAILILILLCFKLFTHPKQTSTASNSKAYEIEIDGKQYSADSLEELNQMVGFDVSYLFNNTSKEKKTNVESKIYENGELATIDTEYGTYKFGVTNATLLQRAPVQGGDNVYQITYIIENKTFDNGDGTGVGLYPEDLTVTDEDGNKCAAFSSYYNNELVNAYDNTPAGKQTEKKAIYKVSNINCNTLEIYMPARGVTCKIPVDNVDEFLSEHKEQQIEVGTPVVISNTSGKMTITIDSIRVDNTANASQSSDSDLLLIDCTIDNTNYDAVGNNSGIDSYWSFTNIIDIKDDQNYTVNSPDSLSMSSDGQYSLYASIRPGSKGRLVLPYKLQKGTKSITIDFRNGTTLTYSLT